VCGDSCSPAVACPTCRRLLEGCWFTLAAMGASPAEDVSQAEALLKRAGARVFDQRTSGLATAQGTPARLCVAQFLQAPHVVVAFRAQMLRAQSMHTALSGVMLVLVLVCSSVQGGRLTPCWRLAVARCPARRVDK